MLRRSLAAVRTCRRLGGLFRRGAWNKNPNPGRRSPKGSELGGRPAISSPGSFRRRDSSFVAFAGEGMSFRLSLCRGGPALLWGGVVKLRSSFSSPFPFLRGEGSRARALSLQRGRAEAAWIVVTSTFAETRWPCGESCNRTRKSSVRSRLRSVRILHRAPVSSAGGFPRPRLRTAPCAGPAAKLFRAGITSAKRALSSVAAAVPLLRCAGRGARSAA